MSKYLVIVESPAKEKTLKKILGKEYLIKSSKGHIMDLPKTSLGIDLEKGFEPKYVIIPKQRDIVRELSIASKNKVHIFLATDPDREGEAIAWHIAQQLKLKEEKNRISFNEITEKAVWQAINKPRLIDLNMVNAQKTRRLLDRLVGYKISPLLWEKIGKKLSAGRVQSVALRLICEREEEIKNFISKEYWLVKGYFKKYKDLKVNSFEAKLYSFEDKKLEIKNELEAKNICQEINTQDSYVQKVIFKKEKKDPLPPFITSTLQQEAFNRFNFPIKKTMHIAQQLYEGISLGEKGSVGLITYMRTDSMRVSEEIIEEAEKYINKCYGKEFIGSKRPKKRKDTNIKIQDAHEAIRPTSVFNYPDNIKTFLNIDQYKIYNLIWRRFLASRMASAILKKSNIEIKAGKYIFKTSGVEVLFPGFMIIYNQDGDELKKLPELKEGNRLELLEITSDQFFTKPPSRYTEASLVKKLEKEGIGRPSTYVPIIDTIKRRLYVEKEGNKFLPTELGIVVNSFLIKYFPHIINVSFTSKMEKLLDEVETEGINWQNILSEFYHTLFKYLEKAKSAIKYEIEPEYSDEICEVCGQKMLIKNSRYGKFLACSGFPKCKNTKPLKEKLGVKCPNSGCSGEIIKKKTRKGRIFYGCSNYPDCNFVSWNEPINDKCPECESILVKKYKKGNLYFKCSNPNCLYQKHP